MSKIILVVLAAVVATALAYPAYIEQVPVIRVVREASPDPGHYKHGYGGGFNGGHHGYGGGYGGGYVGGYGGGYGGHHGYGGGYPHGGYGGDYSHGGGYGGSFSSAHAGAISSPLGSASFSSSNAGYGR